MTSDQAIALVGFIGFALASVSYILQREKRRRAHPAVQVLFWILIIVGMSFAAFRLWTTALPHR